MPYRFQDGDRQGGREVRQFNKLLGANLRDVRKSSGWSLADVTAETHGEFKGSVLGAYERGERAMTVERLSRLCEFYGVHPISVIPHA